MEHDHQDAGLTLRPVVEQLMSRPTLEEVMARARSREAFVAHVNQDGVVESITHVSGSLATMPELWQSDDPAIERVPLSRDDHDRLHAEFQKLDAKGFIFD